MKVLVNSDVIIKNAVYNDFYEELKQHIEVITFGYHDGADIQVPLMTLLTDILQKLNTNIDLIIIFSPEHNLFPPDIINSPIPTVGIILDWEWFYTGILAIAQSFDLILCDKILSNILIKLGYSNVFPWNTVYLQNNIKKINIDKVYDLTFIGSINNCLNYKRDKLLEKLILTLHNKYNLCIKKGIYGEDYFKLLNQSKIIFNHSVSGTINYRVFETLGSGILGLYESTNESIRDIAQDGEHIVLYNENNLKDIIEYYIKNDYERERISTNGYELVHTNFTVKHQVINFLNIVNNINWQSQKSKISKQADLNFYNNLACHYLNKQLPLSNYIINNLNKLDWKIPLSYVMNVINQLSSKSYNIKRLDNLFEYINGPLKFDYNTPIGQYILIFFSLCENKYDYAKSILENLIINLKNESTILDEEFIVLGVIDNNIKITRNFELDKEIYTTIKTTEITKIHKEINKIKKIYLLSTLLVQLGIIYEKMGNINKAIDILNEANNLKESGYVHYILGNIYQNKLEKNKAIEHYLKSCELVPFNIPAREQLTNLLNNDKKERIDRELKLLRQYDL